MEIAPIDVSADRVESPLSVSLKRIGTLSPRSVKDIEDSAWTLGCETNERGLHAVVNYERPGDSFETRPTVFTVAGKTMKNPVCILGGMGSNVYPIVSTFLHAKGGSITANFRK